ncbi:NHL repeat-containing protein 3 isoform X3 [Ambystoma mexicanum]|uniref:NHL repeat-containing protein 3 isoform X3 n=1 Tax=Ambystoma mexicanum TaxID=8296 RepID=UPI0037E91DD8
MISRYKTGFCVAATSLLGMLWLLSWDFPAGKTVNYVYRLDVSWPKYPELFSGQTFAVAVDPHLNLVYVAQRGEKVPKVLVFTEDGLFLGSWNTSTIEMPHGIFAVNRPDQQSVWITDVGNDFNVLWMHGENGTGPTQFYIPHSVTVDSVGRVWVADRGNKRIQVFDKGSGEWLGVWSSCFSEDGPYSVRLTADEKYLIVAQLNINRLNVVAVPPIGTIGDCHVVSRIQLADGVRPHLVDVDVKTGAFYVAEIGSEQVQKYIPHK